MRTDALAVFLAVAAVFGGCYEQHGPAAGGESHFLEACASACEGDLECIGGACTRTCDSGAACADLAAGATCLGPGGATRRVCGVECAFDADCGALGDGFACDEGICRPVEVGVAVAEAPLVLLVVDTSGSMERLAGCTCENAACNNCLPDCARGERNRWAQALEALTGTFEDFGCEALARTEENGMTYDLRYYLPYDRPIEGPQRDDGILDRYADTIRFGVATFDGWDTYVGQAPLLAVTEFDETKSRGADGLWSYGPDDGRRGFFFYPHCVVTYRMDTGIRSAAADEGALTVAIRADAGTVNARAQDELLRSRPYGGTPISGVLDDVYYYFATDPEVQAVPVSDRHVVLITDGYPDDDYREYGCDCTQNSDPGGAGYCGADPREGPCADPAKCPLHPSWMKCPYPAAEEAASYLVRDETQRPGSLPPGEPWRQGPSRQIASLSVVGFDIDPYEPGVRAKLNAIATAGGGAGAHFAATGPELRAALAGILDEILASR